MRRCLTLTVVAAAATMSLSLPALAQNKPGCPPGSWFCADISVAPPAQPAPPQKPQRAQPQQPPQQQEAANPAELDEPEAPVEPEAPPARPARRPRQPTGEAPPVVVYQPVPEPPPQVIVVTPGHRYRHPSYATPPPPPAAPRMRWAPEFGFNLRVEGAALGGRGASGAAGMGGVGLSLRYRPVPAFAFDIGVDVLAGHDYNGFQRVEVPLTLNGLLYLNPRSRVQLYLLGGMHVSRAQVRADYAAPQLALTEDGDFGANYTYFGGQGGGGLEFRISRRVALSTDVVGFVRKRIDDGRVPEFIDYRTGRTTNTSGGALFRGGLTFWW